MGWSDGTLCTIFCAMTSGLVCTIVGSPVDVLKTRLMNMPPGESAVKMVTGMVANEGVKGFYKGFTANFLRLGGWNVAMFLTFEQVKKVFA